MAVVTALLAATQNSLSAQEVSPSPPPASESGESQSDPGPTGAQLKIGAEEGFGLGSLDSDPTALYGPNRVLPALPDNGHLSTLNLSGYYAAKPAPNQRFLFELEGDNDQFGMDMSYSIRPPSWEGTLTANLFLMDGRLQSFESGPIHSGLLSPRGASPWLNQCGGGLEYSQAFTPQLQLAGAFNFRQTTVHDGPLGPRVPPFDQMGNPLTLNPNGVDDMLSFRVVGLFSTLNDKQFANSGTKLRFGIEQTIPVGATQMQSTRLQASYSQFIPLSLFKFSDGPSTLILNVQAGTILGDAPGYDAFNLGGVCSVRGWDQGAMATGRSFFQATAEYRFPLAKPTMFGSELELRGVVFADYGTDLGTAGTVLGRPGAVRGKPGQGAALGAGLHLLSPVGLVRLETGLSNLGTLQVYLSVGDRF